MLKKSCLLEYLITYADTLKENDGKKALSANYFLVSLLKTIGAVGDNQFPDEINNDEAKDLNTALRWSCALPNLCLLHWCLIFFSFFYCYL